MKKFKKYLSVVLACTIAVSAAVVSSSAVDNDDIDTYGSGLEKTSDATNNLQNGSFEKPSIGTKKYDSVDHDNVPNWSTSATDGRIELLRENNMYLTSLVENIDL